jgi:Txe/YoeB family toxin of Txe-Axe toxin-antitoxin module
MQNVNNLNQTPSPEAPNAAEVASEVQGVVPVPEAPAPQEVNRAVEQPSVDPTAVSNAVQPTTSVSTDPVVDQNSTNEPVIVDDTKVDDKKDQTWTEKAKDVIKQYEDKPYQEEEAEEKLQRDYLKERFDVEVKEDKH